MNDARTVLDTLPAFKRAFVSAYVRHAFRTDDPVRAAADDTRVPVAIARDLMQAPDVMDAIARCLGEVNSAPLMGRAPPQADVHDDPIIDARWVLAQLVRLATVSVSELAQDRGDGVPAFRLTMSNLHVLDALPCDIELDGDGFIEKMKLKAPDRTGALRLIGQHADIQAWLDKQQVELTTADQVVARIRAGRARLARDAGTLEEETTDGAT